MYKTDQIWPVQRMPDYSFCGEGNTATKKPNTSVIQQGVFYAQYNLSLVNPKFCPCD